MAALSVMEFSVKHSARSAGRMLGFTLTELLIVIAVFAILMGIALPNFSAFILNQRVKNASFDVFSSLVQSRSEAITRNASVTMAPVAAGNWNSGWTVTAPDGTVLRSEAALPNITLTGPASVVYNGSGRLGSGAAGSFQVTSANTSTARCISVDLSGRPATKASTC